MASGGFWWDFEPPMRRLNEEDEWFLGLSSVDEEGSDCAEDLESIKELYREDIFGVIEAC